MQYFLLVNITLLNKMLWNCAVKGCLLSDWQHGNKHMNSNPIKPPVIDQKMLIKSQKLRKKAYKASKKIISCFRF